MILKLTAAGADSAIVDESGLNAIEYVQRRGLVLTPIYLEALNSAFDCSFVDLK